MIEKNLRHIILHLKSQLLDRTLWRFIIIGCTNTIISYLLFISVLKVGFYFSLPFSVFIAQFVSCSIALLWSYYWNRKWTFKSKEGSGKEFIRFLVSQILYMILTALALHFLIIISGFNPSLSWVGVMIVATLLNYIALKRFVFMSN